MTVAFDHQTPVRFDSSPPGRTGLRRALEDLLRAACRGRIDPWPPASDSAPSEDEARFLEATERHGLQPLLATALRRAHSSDWPAVVRTSLATALREAAILEPIRRAEILHVATALDEAGLQPVIFKGASVAYSCYPAPHLRPMRDVDMLVTAPDGLRPAAVMDQLGYKPLEGITGTLLHAQQDFEGRDRLGVTHIVDVHWQVTDVHMFAHALPVEALTRRAVPLPAIGPSARGLAPIDALLVGCVHRVAHHGPEAALVWLADLCHLAARLGQRDEWPEFLRRVREGRLWGLCAEALGQALHWFGAAVPDGVLEELRANARQRRSPADAFLKGRPTSLRVLMLDLQALPGFGRKIRLLREHAFPPPAYLRYRYATSTRAFLPLFYVHRLARGAWRWLGERHAL